MTSDLSDLRGDLIPLSQTFRGLLHLDVGQPMPLRNLRLIVEGVQKVYWEESRSNGKYDQPASPHLTSHSINPGGLGLLPLSLALNLAFRVLLTLLARTNYTLIFSKYVAFFAVAATLIEVVQDKDEKDKQTVTLTFDDLA